MKKALFIVGPTGVGKTDLGLSLSSRFSGNIISADSIQVYTGLDVVSGKDLPEGSVFTDISSDFSRLRKYKIGFYDFGNVPVYLLDVVAPTYDFSVHDFIECAVPVSDYIYSEKKLPVYVGGTGLYVKALLDGIDTNSIPKDIGLRNALDKLSLLELQEILEKENESKFSLMNESDKNNPRRLVRAIEVARFSAKGNVQKKSQKINLDSLVVGLRCEREILRERIDKRVDKRIKMGGLEEAESMFKQYENLSPQVKNGNGYKQLFEYFFGITNYEEAIEKWKISEYLHAKNQMTWFLKDKRIVWFDILDKKYLKNVEETVTNWYNNSNE